MKPNTIIEGPYGFTKYEGHPAHYRPEPTQAERDAERQADEITSDDLGLALDQVDLLIKWGFPTPMRTITRGRVWKRSVLVFSRAQARDWYRSRLLPITMTLSDKF